MDTSNNNPSIDDVMDLMDKYNVKYDVYTVLDTLAELLSTVDTVVKDHDNEDFEHLDDLRKRLRSVRGDS